VQWMTAGSGVQHSEMFPLLNQDKENPLELFQIWLNLPKAKKFAAPHFAMLWHEDIPIVQENGAFVKVVAGTYAAKNAPAPAPDSWANDPENEVLIWNIQLDPHASFTLPPSKTAVNRTVYYYEGETITIEEEVVRPDHGVALQSLVTTTIQNGSEKSHILVLQGKPIDEPVAKYGPFVMNTDSEIEDAMQEYRVTQFGGWPWRHSDNVHEREKGRFAKYPDGSVIEK